MSYKKEFDELTATKKLLYYHNENKQAICSLKDMLKNLDGKKGVNYDGMPGGTDIGDPTSKIALERAWLSIKLKNTERIVNIVDNALSLLSGFEKEIVIKKYVEGYTWSKITIDFAYSRSGARKIGKKGLESVSKAIFGEKDIRIETK